MEKESKEKGSKEKESKVWQKRVNQLNFLAYAKCEENLECRLTFKYPKNKVLTEKTFFHLLCLVSSFYITIPLSSHPFNSFLF